MRNSGAGTDQGGVRLDWPGRPSAFLPPVPPDLASLSVAELWPGGSNAAASLIVSGDAAAVLDAWRGRATVLSTQGPVRLVYLDPPFATGTTFTADIPIGERRPGQRVLRLPAYRDVWPGGLAGYLTSMAGLLARLRDVLADDGWLCLHCDHRTSAHLRLLLDELFGPDGFRNEIVWSYGLGNGTSRRGFPRKHDTLLLYAKSAAAVFTPIRGAVSPAMANKYRHVRPDGTRFMRSYGREYDLRGGKPVGSVWEIPSVAPTSGERTGYPTQKPVALLERLIAATTAPGDTVLDPCCGSGTTLIAASGLGRQSVGIDASWLAIATARARLVQAGGPVTMVDTNHDERQRRADPSDPDGPDSPTWRTGSETGGRLRQDRPPPLLTATPSVVKSSAHSSEDLVSGIRVKTPLSGTGEPTTACSGGSDPGAGEGLGEGSARRRSAPRDTTSVQSDSVLLPSPGGEEGRRAEPGRGRGRGLLPSSGASDANQPVGGDDTAPPRWYRLSATARWLTETESDGTTDALCVTLDGLTVEGHGTSDPSNSPFVVHHDRLVRHEPDAPPLTDHWSDWLTGWAVHLGRHRGTPETPFVAVASSHRIGRSRVLETTLTVPDAASDHHLAEAVTVRLYDLFGASSDHVVPTGPG